MKLHIALLTTYGLRCLSAALPEPSAKGDIKSVTYFETSPKGGIKSVTYIPASGLKWHEDGSLRPLFPRKQPTADNEQADNEQADYEHANNGQANNGQANNRQANNGYNKCVPSQDKETCICGLTTVNSRIIYMEAYRMRVCPTEVGPDGKADDRSAMFFDYHHDGQPWSSPEVKLDEKTRKKIEVIPLLEPFRCELPQVYPIDNRENKLRCECGLIDVDAGTRPGDPMKMTCPQYVWRNGQDTQSFLPTLFDRPDLETMGQLMTGVPYKVQPSPDQEQYPGVPG